MTALELLEVMGSIRDPYVQEAHGKRRGMPRRRALLIAAIIALMLLLVGCVAVFLGIQDLKIRERTDPDHPNVKDFISLQGYAGSPGYMAQKEWLEFLDSYDQDQNLLELSPFDSYVEPEEYRIYNCYTPEMVDMVDMLCEKYDLERLTRLYLNWENEDIFSAVGIDGIFRQNPDAETYLYGGCFTQDGSFNFSGYLNLTGENAPWIYPVDYQFLCARKGTFQNGFYVGVGDIGSYEQWRYTTKNGVEVLLAMNDEKALILADREDCFISVNILATRAGDVLLGELAMSPEALEAIAELFDFTQSPQTVDIAAADEKEAQRETEFQLRLEQVRATERRESYSEYLTDYLNDSQGSYVLLDFDGNGVEELCYTYLENYTGLYTISGGFVKEFDIYAFYNGYQLYQTVEGGYVLGSTRMAGQQTYFLFMEVDGDVLRYRDFLKLDPATDPENPWFRCSNALGMEVMDFIDSPMYWEPLTREDYASILDGYTPYNPNTTPVSYMLLTESDLYEQYQQQYPGEGLWFFQEDYDGDGYLDLAVFYQGAFRALHLLDERGQVTYQWKRQEGFLFYETYIQNVQQVAYEGYLPGYSFAEDEVEYHVFLHISGNGLQIRDCLRYDPANKEWARARSAEALHITLEQPLADQLTEWDPITQAEYTQILEGYQEKVYELS